jgi:guanylate kinase
MARGAFFVFVGPSAVGKTTVVERLLSLVPSSVRLVTTTSRPPRPGEVDGRDYHFVSRDEFAAKRDNGEFLEWNEFCGNSYGSSKVVLDALRAGHQAVFAVLDVNGAKAVKAAVPDAVTVFLQPGSLGELEQRLAERPGNKAADAWARYEQAAKEIIRAPEFDHAVVNQDGQIDRTIAEIIAIIRRHQAVSAGG